MAHWPVGQATYAYGVGRWVVVLCLVALGLAACGTTTQTVTGVLVEEGGPYPGIHALVPGSIRLVGTPGTFSTDAGRNGTFSLEAPTGTYRIEGRPANWSESGYPCGGQQVTVTAGKTLQTTVACEVP